MGIFDNPILARPLLTILPNAGFNNLPHNIKFRLKNMMNVAM
ncbi:Uncharacterised protein [Yersinia frederiksenii]|nr:Uncharacterised protein [Yersinia frederiksenii]CNL12034.1 Uncharacterised protein [Yersinia frederiksenii]